MRKIIYTILQLCEKNDNLANKTYHLRKWLYLKVLRLKVCHFCLEFYDRGGKYYCLDCMEETN